MAPFSRARFSRPIRDRDTEFLTCDSSGGRAVQPVPCCGSAAIESSPCFLANGRRASCKKGRTIFQRSLRRCCCRHWRHRHSRHCCQPVVNMRTNPPLLGPPWWRTRSPLPFPSRSMVHRDLIAVPQPMNAPVNSSTPWCASMLPVAALRRTTGPPATHSQRPPAVGGPAQRAPLPPFESSTFIGRRSRDPPLFLSAMLLKRIKSTFFTLFFLLSCLRVPSISQGLTLISCTSKHKENASLFIFLRLPDSQAWSSWKHFPAVHRRFSLKVAILLCELCLSLHSPPTRATNGP